MLTSFETKLPHHIVSVFTFQTSLISWNFHEWKLTYCFLPISALHHHILSNYRMTIIAHYIPIMLICMSNFFSRSKVTCFSTSSMEKQGNQDLSRMINLLCTNHHQNIKWDWTYHHFKWSFTCYFACILLLVTFFTLYFAE